MEKYLVGLVWFFGELVISSMREACQMMLRCCSSLASGAYQYSKYIYIHTHIHISAVTTDAFVHTSL
jgi:hypothetical protein